MPFPLKHFPTYVNKTIGFRFCGRDLTFRLSHALFSSFDIDDGTRLLLKSIAQQVDLERVRSCLDIGCGVGVIGVCIQSRLPNAAVVMQDRDALAAAFAEYNSRENGGERIEVQCALAFQNLDGRSFDLVTSNVPAKAGQPVLESFFRQAAAFLTPNGIAAVVIVATLVPFALSTLKGLGCQIVFSEATRKHTTLHFGPGPASVDLDDPPGSLVPYIRGTQIFTHTEGSYELETAWSLPDFDTLGHSLTLSFNLLRSQQVKGELLVWNPGQGHLAVYLLGRHGRSISAITLAGRDSLELEITSRNLRALGKEPRRVSTVPTESGLLDTLQRGDKVDFLCAVPHPIPRVPWQPEMAEAASGVVKPGGLFFIVTTSTEAHRLLAELHGWQVVAGRKQFGFRAMLLKNVAKE